MDDFSTKVFIKHSEANDTDAIIRVDRYARELRSFIMYKQVDKISKKPISPQQISQLKSEMKRAEAWVDENQHKLSGL